MYQLGFTVSLHRRLDGYMVVWGYDADVCQSSMGFARLAETGIRKIRGKGDNDKLGALDKILASSVGGALATWNQPIEVIRVEVSDNQKISHSSVNPLSIDAIHGQIRQPSRQPYHHEHTRVHLQGERHKRSLPWCDAPYRLGYLADYLHGFLRRLC